MSYLIQESLPQIAVLASIILLILIWEKSEVFYDCKVFE
jgi:hypothetical protein